MEEQMSKIDNSNHLKIEHFRNRHKSNPTQITEINKLIDEYSQLDKYDPSRTTIDKIFSILCGQSLDKLIAYKGRVDGDPVTELNITIQDLKENYWNLKESLRKSQSRTNNFSF